MSFAVPADMVDLAASMPLDSDASPTDTSACDTSLRSLEGTVQRVNYPQRELTVIATGQVWRFALDPDCQLWFDDQQAILRCFHPLDRVRILFTPEEDGHRAKAIFAWERPV